MIIRNLLDSRPLIAIDYDAIDAVIGQNAQDKEQLAQHMKAMQDFATWVQDNIPNISVEQPIEESKLKERLDKPKRKKEAEDVAED